MSIETERPSSTIDAGDSVPTSGTLNTVTDDSPADDATYFALGSDPATIAFTPPSTPGVVGAKLRVRCNTQASGQMTVATNGEDPYLSRVGVVSQLKGDLVFPGGYGLMPAGAWDEDDPRLTIAASGTSDIKVYELYIDFVTLDDPVVTADVFLDTITFTNTPLIEWTSVLDPDGGDRTHYEVKLYENIGIPDPDVDPALEESGEVASFAESYQIATVLPNGDYRAWIRVAQTFAGEQVWSEWVLSDFTIDVDLPHIPEITLTPVDDHGLIDFVLDSGNALTTAGVNLIDNQSFETDLADWSATDGATITQDATDSVIGTHSMKLVTDGDTTQEYARHDGVSVSPGVTYIATARVKAAGGATMRIRISEQDVTDVEVGSDQTEFVTTGEWQYVAVLHQMGADADTAKLQIGASSTAQVISALIDRTTLNDAEAEVANSGFEENLDGWHTTGGSGSTRTRSDEASKGGDWSQKVVTDGTGSNQGAASDNFPLAPSQTHTLRVYVKGLNGAGLRVQLQERDSGGSQIGSPGQQDFTANGNWQLIEVEKTFGATGVLGTVNVKTDQTGEATYFYFDEVIVTEGPEVPTDAYQVQRSDDGGITWADIRTPLGDGRVSLRSNPRDYEATNGGMVHYRVRAVATPTTSGAVYSAWAEAQDYWQSEDVWLKHPFSPWLSMKIGIASNPTRRRDHDVAEFKVLGRQCKITVSNARGPAEGELTLNVFTEADQAALDVLLDDLAPLLLQCPPGWHWPDRWVVFKGTHDRPRAVDKAWVEFTRDALTWLAVPPPDDNLLAFRITEIE